MFTSVEEWRFENFSNYIVEEILRKVFTIGCRDSSELKPGVWILGVKKGQACELWREEVRLGIKVVLGVRLGLTLVLGILFDGVGQEFTRRKSLWPPLAKPLPKVDPNVIT